MSEKKKQMTDGEFTEMLEDRIERASNGESASEEEVEEVFSDC